MTDKVQKIREEVEKLRIKNTEAFDCGCDGTKCAGYNMACDDILSIIDSMQEEPAPKIFEDMLNAKTPAESLDISAEEHDKIINLCLYGEKPVSEELEEAAEKYRKELHDSESDVDDEGYMYECVPSDAFKAGEECHGADDSILLVAAKVANIIKI